MTDETGLLVRSIHDGSWLGWGCCSWQAAASRPSHAVRSIQTHRGTGIGFRLSQAWLGWTKEQAQILLDIYQGTLLFGRDYRA